VVLKLLPEHLVIREDRVQVADHFPVLLPEKPGLVLLKLQVALKGLPAGLRVLESDLGRVELATGAATVLNALP
jgi:hypothetical protein